MDTIMAGLPRARKVWSQSSRSTHKSYLKCITALLCRVSGGEVEACVNDLVLYLVNKELVRKAPDIMLAREKRVLENIAHLYCNAPPLAKCAVLSTVAQEYGYTSLREVGFSCGWNQFTKAQKHRVGKWHGTRICVGRKPTSAAVRIAVINFAYQWTKGSAHETLAESRSASRKLVHLRHHIHSKCLTAKQLADQLREISSAASSPLSQEEVCNHLQQVTGDDHELFTQTMEEFSGTSRCCMNEHCPVEVKLANYDPASGLPKPTLYDEYVETRKCAERRIEKKLLSISRRQLYREYLVAGYPKISLRKFLQLLPRDIGPAKCRTGLMLHNLQLLLT